MNKPQRPTGTCPVCNGTKRVPVPSEAQGYKKSISGYDPGTDTFPCSNCGGQYMSGRPTGQVNLRKDGQPCIHEYISELLGRCYRGYTCKHCGDYHTIDSGD